LTNKKNLFNLNIVKKLLSTISGLIAYASMALPAYADTTIDPCTGSTSLTGIAKVMCDLKSENAAKIIQNIIVFIIVIAVIIALMYLLYGGIKWITSKGEKAEVESARNHITAAIVGLIIVFLAVFIITILLGVFGLGTNNLTILKII
jgi:amino acid transporter